MVSLRLEASKLFFFFFFAFRYLDNTLCYLIQVVEVRPPEKLKPRTLVSDGPDNNVRKEVTKDYRRV